MAYFYNEMGESVNILIVKLNICGIVNELNFVLTIGQN